MLPRILLSDRWSFKIEREIKKLKLKEFISRDLNLQEMLNFQAEEEQYRLEIWISAKGKNAREGIKEDKIIFFKCYSS